MLLAVVVPFDPVPGPDPGTVVAIMVPVDPVGLVIVVPVDPVEPIIVVPVETGIVLLDQTMVSIIVDAADEVASVDPLELLIV